jgi:hypothetical protein
MRRGMNQKQTFIVETNEREGFFAFLFGEAFLNSFSLLQLQLTQKESLHSNKQDKERKGDGKKSLQTLKPTGQK